MALREYTAIVVGVPSPRRGEDKGEGRFSCIIIYSHLLKNMKSRHRINPNTLRLARDLRSNQTATERLLWHALRNRNLKYKFRRQYPIDQYVVDFYCPRVKLCIEIDGGTHYEAGQEDYDIIRTAYLERLGYKVIRFTNDDVHKNINAVADGIVLEIEGIIAHE